MRSLENSTSNMHLLSMDSDHPIQVRYRFHLVRPGQIITTHYEPESTEDRMLVAMAGTMSSQFMPFQIENQAQSPLVLGTRTLPSEDGNTGLSKTVKTPVHKAGLMILSFMHTHILSEGTYVI